MTVTVIVMELGRLMRITIISCTSKYKSSRQNHDVVYYAVVTEVETGCPFLLGENIYRTITGLSVVPQKYSTEAVVHPDSYDFWERI
jgi:hypothetical protein